MTYISPTEINWSLGFQEIFSYANSVSNGMFSIMLLIAIYIIIIMGIAKNRDFAESASISGFVTFLIAMGFYLAGTINIIVIMFVFVIAIISLLFLWFSKKSY